MKLTVQNRLITGKKVKILRREMLIPAIIYGKSLDTPKTITVHKNEFLKAYKQVGKAMPLDLVTEDGKFNQMVLIHDYQVDPVTDYLVHVDFMAINKNEKVHATVTLEFVGVSPIEKAKTGRIQVLKDSVEVEALPKDLPKSMEVHLDKILSDQDVLFVKDIVVPKGVKILDHDDQAVVTVVSINDGSDDEDTDTSAPTEEVAPAAK